MMTMIPTRIMVVIIEITVVRIVRPRVLKIQCHSNMMGASILYRSQPMLTCTAVPVMDSANSIDQVCHQS